MTESQWIQTVKQEEAWTRLHDDVTEEILFGGGAGGGKTLLGCSWIIIACGMYPGTRWLMGRSKLKSLKETTLVTFFDVCKAWGIKQNVHYKYNSLDGTITWTNGSVILLKDLFAYPSDPNFDSLGSLEITGAFIDEANQVSFKCIEVVKSRIRYKLDECGLIPKILMTCNPSKGWPYLEFYKPSKAKTIPKHRKFIQALAKDNPFITKLYVENLRKIKNKAIRERLLHGNWEYDDDPGVMFPYDVITDLFTNKAVGDGKWITADVSRKGSDKFPVMFWEGLQVKEIVVLQPEIRQDITKASKWIIDYAERKGVRRSNIIIDEDGVGGGVVDTVKCTGFINNARQVQTKEFEEGDETKRLNYANLKAQCYDMLSTLAEEGKVGIDDPQDSDIRDAIVEELEMIKRIDVDKDGPFRVIGKDAIKEELGRSPDFADSLMMRMYGIIKPKEYSPNIRTI